jgi:hypothetical protein
MKYPMAAMRAGQPRHRRRQVAIWTAAAAAIIVVSRN